MDILTIIGVGILCLLCVFLVKRSGSFAMRAVALKKDVEHSAHLFSDGEMKWMQSCFSFVRTWDRIMSGAIVFGAIVLIGVRLKLDMTDMLLMEKIILHSLSLVLIAVLGFGGGYALRLFSNTIGDVTSLIEKASRSSPSSGTSIP